MNALNGMNYSEAKKFSTTETCKLIDFISSFSSMIPDSIKNETKKIRITISNTSIEGDTATVYYYGSNKIDSKTLKLTRYSGKWFVNMTKYDLDNSEYLPKDPKFTLPTKPTQKEIIKNPEEPQQIQKSTVKQVSKAQPVKLHTQIKKANSTKNKNKINHESKGPKWVED